MDVKALVELLIRQKIAESRNHPQFSQEWLMQQVLEILKQRGIQIDEASKQLLNVPKNTQANNKSIALGSDHGGFEMKQILLEYLKSKNYLVQDVGAYSTEAVDYPDLAEKVAQLVVQRQCALGIIIDGAGIGSCMAANKVPGIRASHCHNLFEAKNAREHNNANVLSLGGRVIGSELAKEIVRVWLETEFAGGRHQKRVDKIMAIEQKHLRS